MTECYIDFITLNDSVLLILITLHDRVLYWFQLPWMTECSIDSIYLEWQGVLLIPITLNDRVFYWFQLPWMTECHIDSNYLKWQSVDIDAFWFQMTSHPFNAHVIGHLKMLKERRTVLNECMIKNNTSRGFKRTFFLAIRYCHSPFWASVTEEGDDCGWLELK